MGKLTLISCKVLLGLLFMTTAFAEETVNEDGRIIPGSRPLASSEWMKIQQAHADEDANTKEEIVLDASTHLEAVASVPALETIQSSLFNAEVFFTSHNGAYHHPCAVSHLGAVVELEDGSIWSISDGDRYKTLNWLTNDLIVLTPNHDWFSTCLFRMSNQNTGVSVKCNISFGPIYNGLYTHWIVAINYYTQEIFLEDGSIWQAIGFDSSVFSQWLLNDTIIIGVNDGFLSSTKPNILINVNTVTYARAICTW